MKDIHQTYLDNFIRIGEKKLHDCGFLFTLTPLERFPELFAMRLTRGNDEYVLCFSVHHLDWQDGVMVYRSTNGNYNWDDRVLPPPSLPVELNSYAFTGNAMLADIERIVNDICSL